MDGNSQQTAHNRQVLQHHRLLHSRLLRRETPAENGMENQGGRDQEKKEKQCGQSRLVAKEHRQSSSRFNENSTKEQKRRGRHSPGGHIGLSARKTANFADARQKENTR